MTELLAAALMIGLKVQMISDRYKHLPANQTTPTVIGIVETKPETINYQTIIWVKVISTTKPQEFFVGLVVAKDGTMTDGTGMRMRIYAGS